MRLTFLLELRFFGLTASSKHFILEYIYVLIKHLGFSYKDAYNLPVWKRDWFVNKFIEEKKQINESRKNNVNTQSKSSNSSRRLFKK